MVLEPHWGTILVMFLDGWQERWRQGMTHYSPHVQALVEHLIAASREPDVSEETLTTLARPIFQAMWKERRDG